MVFVTVFNHGTEGTELNEEMARSWVYLDEVERRMFAHAQPQHRKAARRK